MLGPTLGVPARTITRILRRHQMPRLSDCDPLTGEVIRASKTIAVRYGRDRPGELVHVDVKKLGRIPDGGGWRAWGLDGTRRGQRVGYDSVHSVVDDHSRLAYSEILPDETGDTCASFMLRAAAWFADHGIDQISEIMTDNALTYTNSGTFRQVIDLIGADHITIRPHCPWQNGKMERFNRTLQVESAYRQMFAAHDERYAALGGSLDQYNYHRSRGALGGQPPISRVSPNLMTGYTNGRAEAALRGRR